MHREPLFVMKPFMNSEQLKVSGDSMHRFSAAVIDEMNTMGIRLLFL